MATCEPLQGNPDFYGLGIRIGVYLQWISAWISLLLAQDQAQAIFDTNSVFVFAIIIATVIAAKQGAAAIEMYIMLQITLGFFVTTLSGLGIRLWFMRSQRLTELQRLLSNIRRQVSPETKTGADAGAQADAGADNRQETGVIEGTEAKTNVKPDVGKASENDGQEGSAGQPGPHAFRSRMRRFLDDFVGELVVAMPMIQLGIIAFTWTSKEPKAPAPPSVSKVPLTSLGSLKPPGLSWSGVAWRTGTAAVVASYNIAYWYPDTKSGVAQPVASGCEAPYIFLFSRQQLAGPVIGLGKVAAIIIAVCIYPLALGLVFFSIRLWLYAVLFLYRDMIYALHPNAPDKVRSAERRINDLLGKKGISLTMLPSPMDFYPATRVLAMALPHQFTSFSDMIEFFATPKADAIRFSDVIKLTVSLGMGKLSVDSRRESAQKRDTDTPENSNSTASSSSYRPFSIMWNVLVVLSIVWFIVSIECTIYWNDIRGVNAIDNTGQLIPLIIGCVTTTQVIKKLALLALAKFYPDWSNVSLEVQGVLDRPEIFRIDVVRRTPDDAEALPHVAQNVGQPGVLNHGTSGEAL